MRGWQDFELALSRAESMTTEQLAALANGIPLDWWAKQHTLELDCLLADLFQRRAKIRNLITDFRNSSRNPFPNWTDTPMVSVPANPA